MDFEFDPRKSEANKKKHGIDFIEAQALWNDDKRVEYPAKEADEPRFAVIGKILDIYWSAFITYRGDSIRIISIRRSRAKEVALYESQGFG